MNKDQYCGCPYCDTVFRIPQTKVESLPKRVRCGSCNEIFDSTAQLMEKTKDGYVTVYQNKESADGEASNPDSSDTLNVEEPNAFWSDEPPDDNDEHGLFENQADAQTEDDDDDDEVDDVFHGGIHNPFESEEDEPSEDEFEYDDEFEEPTLDSDDSDSNGDIDSDLDYHKEMYGLEQHRRANDQRNSPRMDDDESESDFDDLSIPSSSPYKSKSDKATRDNKKKNGANDYIKKRKNPFASVAWGIVSLLFLILLGMQIKHFFVEKYSQDEVYRKYLVGFCKIARCELPPRQDPSRFTLTHTRIDLHPTQPGALRITVKLINEADFAQPHPFLQLTLTDRVSRIVGRRTFSPKSYLSDSVPGLIDAGELVTILFDLSRPHQKAVGFVVDIVNAPAP